MGKKKGANSSPVKSVPMLTEWWLVKVDGYGTVMELSDGPHEDRKGVEQALYLYRSFGLIDDSCRNYCCASIACSRVEAKNHDVRGKSVADLRKATGRTGRHKHGC